jgi:hypothetical protein
VSHRFRSSPRILICFAVFSFLIFRYGGGEARPGFSLREKLAEFKCGLGFVKTIFWGKGFGKTSAEFSACRKGSGE